ncbi:hypothetical protein [Streptomyces albicerus]|uniref:hypothetical protein n=1 Tax=Streptomyces albicerus TaxID=2569859 RepID=UPI00124B6B76|nr:hypothetical protein [Streptomyces albicerus]
MSHKNSQVKPPLNERVLAIGIRADAFTQDTLPPQFSTLEELAAALDRGWADLQAAGIDGEVCGIGLDVDEAEAELRRKFDGQSFGVALIGGGIRNVPENTVLFERIVNVLIDLQPGIRLSFNTHPNNALEALQRWLGR